MLLDEQVRSVSADVLKASTPAAFRHNVRVLQFEHGLPRNEAMALACALLKSGGGKSDVLEKFLTATELNLVQKYGSILGQMKETPAVDDSLKIISEIDSILSKGPLVEQRPAVASVIANIEDDLKRGILVGLARMMREMGYDRWPHDPEGKADIEGVIEAVAHELVKMGRRFNMLMRVELRKLKTRGPKAYEKIVRRWLAGKPAEDEPGDTTEDDTTMRKCKECDGTGKDKDDEECEECGGTGTLYDNPVPDDVDEGGNPEDMKPEKEVAPKEKEKS